MRATLAKAMMLTATAVAASLVTAPAAVAAGGDTIVGGCGFDTDENATVTGPDTNVGFIWDWSATRDAAGLPTDATVSCQIRVNYVAAPATTYSYSGFAVQAGVDRITYTAGPGDVIDWCERVVYADGTDTGWQCPPPPFPDLCDVERGCPSPWVIDLINAVLDPVNQAVIDYVDPAVCPLLVANAGTYGPVTISPDGDVYIPDPFVLFGGPVYDCPPYGNF